MKFAVNSSKTVTLSLGLTVALSTVPARPESIPNSNRSLAVLVASSRPVSLHSKNIILKIPPTFLWRLCKHSFTVKRESAAEQACAAAMANRGGPGAAVQSTKKITGTKRKRRKILIIPNEMINYSEKRPDSGIWTSLDRHDYRSVAGVVHHHHHHHIVVVWFGLVWRNFQHFTILHAQQVRMRKLPLFCCCRWRCSRPKNARQQHKIPFA